MQQSETLAFETVSKSWLDKLGIIGLIDERSTGLKVEKVAFSANGSWFITVNVENSNALVWECGMSKRPRLVHLPDKERIRDLKISNNGSILITRNNGVVDVLRILDDNIVQLLFRDHLQHGPASTVEFDPNNDEVFFSGGLDGIIRQHDMRISNTDRKLFDTQSPHYIPTGTKQFPILQEVGKKIQIIVINSVFPHLIVIGTNDAKVQLFSRDTSNSPPSPTSYLKDDIHELLLLESFCPHHFQHNDCSKMYPTCIKFHPNGKSLLINYHLDHTYEFNIHSITPDTSAIEESNRHKTSHTPWWMKFNKCTSVFEQVDLVKEILYQSNCAKDLNFLSRSVALLSIALELLMEISESANDQGMSTSFMEEITSIRSHSLFLRTRIYLNRKFRGDTHAALNDLKTILTFSPFDVSAKILQCKIHILLNKPAKVVPLIEELEVLLTLNTSSSSLISVKADIQNLKNEVDQLLKGSSHGSIIEDANEETGNMSTNWRTRYEGLTNIDQNQEVAYFGVEGKVRNQIQFEYYKYHQH